MVGSTVGAGDAFAAGLAYGWKYHLEPDKTMELCMAASAATVTTQGTKPASAELINELNELCNKLTVTGRQLSKYGKDKAIAEHDYKICLRQEALKLRS